jgi:hypothetical protein
MARSDHPLHGLTRGFCAVRPVFLATALLAAAVATASAQTPWRASFRVLERGVSVGGVDVSLSRDGEGWRIRSTGRADGTVNVAVRQFDAVYTENWEARFLTVEWIAARESTIVHVAVGRATAHTDLVTEQEANWRSHSVSPDTIFLPEHAYGAFAAIAARLHASGRRREIPLLVAPEGELRALVGAAESLTVETRAGPLRVARHTLSIVGAVPRPIHVWEPGGELVRVDVPAHRLTVVREDVVGQRFIP